MLSQLKNRRLKARLSTKRIAPSFWRWPLELRALMWIPFDKTIMPLWGRLYQLLRGRDAKVIIVLPGFCANDAFTSILRYFLKSLGHAVYGWENGFNMGGTIEALDKKLTCLVERVYQENHQRKVVLIGWSLGGIYARWLAHIQPQYIQSIITLGTPFRKIDLGVNIDWLFKKITGQDPNHYRSVLNLVKRTPPVPTTSIFSGADGVVAKECCYQINTSNAESICLPYVSHLGMVTNPMVFKVISDRLSTNEERWTPYEKSLPSRKLAETRYSSF